MWECANADGRADPYARWADSPHQAQYRDEAEQALLAVGDALRLEGAQAERARAVAAVMALVNPDARGLDDYNLNLEDVLDALGKETL